jgi:hypothetical protein
MAFNRANPKNYVKGTMEVWVHDYVTGDLDYYSNTVQNNQFATTVNMSPVNGGLGNPVLINLPDSSAVNLTLTNADFSLEARALSVGGTLSYNAIVPVIKTITAVGTTLTVPDTPVAPYGIDSIFCFVGESGTAYTIDADTKVVQNFTATAGTSYCVRYFMNNNSAQALRMASVFAPAIKTVMIRLPAFSAQGTTANQSTLKGNYYIWIPRMQFGAKADADGSQTAASTTDLSGSALSYEDAAASGVCVDSSQASLAYMVYMPLAGASSAIQGLYIVGGVINAVVGTPIQTPVKAVMPDGTSIQPTYSNLTFAVTQTSIATVGANTGLIQPLTAGDTEITVTVTDSSPAISTVANLSVTTS